MSENFIFDCKNWKINTSRLDCSPTTSTAGRGVSGRKQVVFRRNQYWRGAITINPLRTYVMQDYQGFIDGLLGQYNTFDLCICDPLSLKGEGLPHLEWLKLLGYSGVSKLCGPDANGLYGEPFADGTCFADGSGFKIPEFQQAVVVNSAGEGATTIQMNGASGFLKRGNRFSTVDNYMHRITKISGRTVTFNPPLRRSMIAGEKLETQSPKVRVRLSDDESGVPAVKYGRYTDEITLNVEEVMDR